MPMRMPPFLKPWKRRKIKYVIYAPDYSDQHGGVMALYGLADALNKIGAGALIWPFDLSPGRRDLLKDRMRRLSRKTVGAFRRSEVQDDGGDDHGPMALRVLRTSGSTGEPARPSRRPTWFELRAAVIVYPEIIDGNPLGGDHVVRWFLNKPGRLTGRIDYGPGELYFYQQEIFNDPDLNPGGDGGELTIVSVMDDIYHRSNFGKRSGTCYILRKGRARAPDPSQLDGPVIDEMPHREIAKLFNECEYCISYDLHTFYSYYAALCGCKSIVVPEPGLDRASWQPIEEFTSGVAYGMDDIDRAESTKPRLREVLKQIEDKNLAAAAAFHRRCERFFFAD